MRIYAIIPGLNVAGTVGPVVRETRRHVNRVIFVDDGSTDKSGAVAKKAGAHAIVLDRNYGKGFALRAGMKQALREGADVIITLDSDGQHYPKYIPAFLRALRDADVVIGSRYAGRFYTLTRNVIGNYGLSFITNILASGPQGFLRHRWIADTESGFRAFRAGALRRMDLRGMRYEIEAECVYEAMRKGLKVVEVPIVTRARIKGVRIRDGVSNGLYLFKKAFRL